MPKNLKKLEPEKRILGLIMIIRGEKVILDSDLAELYCVETRRLNEQVRRNIDKFPDDFMFQLTKQEFDDLKSQIATSSSGWGGRRKPPLVFTEHGALQAAKVKGKGVIKGSSLPLTLALKKPEKFRLRNTMSSIINMGKIMGEVLLRVNGRLDPLTVTVGTLPVTKIAWMAAE